MKSLIIGLLAFACITGNSFAQQEIINRPAVLTRTDAIFQGISSSNIKFDFQLANGNKMTIELYSLKQMDSFPDINTLTKMVWDDLQNFKDSLSIPLMNRRIDFTISRVDKKIRIIQYPQRGSVFSIKNGDVTQLKVEQDTLRIRMFTTGTINSRGVVVGFAYYVTFLLNNTTDLEYISKSEKLNYAIQLLKNDIATDVKKQKKSGDTYNATYDVESGKRIRPVVLPIMNTASKKTTIQPPYVQIGIQYLRGEWVPSAGVGFDIQKKVGITRTENFRFIWEPYFFFSRNTSKELTVDRNDFVSFKYSIASKVITSTSQIQFLQTVSLGYLVSRKGEWLEKHTIKFSLPGLHTKNILLEPEFVFNDFFKNFSPSLKLVLYFE